MKKLMVAATIALCVPAYAARAQNAPQAGGAADLTRFTQHFRFDALTPEVQASITRANLAPVPFATITLRTRDSVSLPAHTQSSAYTTDITLENAGHGLVRRVEIVKDKGGHTIATRLDLTYRGYFSFLTQGMLSRTKSVPPVQEVRKVLRFDTEAAGHFGFVYLYGSAGAPAFKDPGQFLCVHGKSLSASQLNPSIAGQAVELNCRMIDSNGIETDKVTLAYLKKYAVAITLRTHNTQRTVDSTIIDFSVH